MRELLTVVTQKGQVTIPVEIRRALGLKEGDFVAFVMKNDQALLMRTGSVVERTAGILKRGEPPLTAEALREAAERAIAETSVKRMGG